MNMQKIIYLFLTPNADVFSSEITTELNRNILPLEQYLV